MNYYTHILFPTALIQQSLLIGEKAAQLAKQSGARLSLLHVIEPQHKHRFLNADSGSIDTELINSRREQLSELGRLLSVPEANQHLRIGVPKLHIMDIVNQISPDLIIVASHAHEGSLHMPRSTALAIILRAPCDVLTVQVPGSYKGKYRQILLPIALLEHTVMVAEHAASFAECCDAKLNLLHVVEPFPGYGFGYVTPDLIFSRIKANALTRLAEIGLKARVPEQNLYLRSGVPKIQILKTAKEIDADLIIISNHGDHGTFHFFGSITSALINKSMCDILTVRLRKKF